MAAISICLRCMAARLPKWRSVVSFDKSLKSIPASGKKAHLSVPVEKIKIQYIYRALSFVLFRATINWLLVSLICQEHTLADSYKNRHGLTTLRQKIRELIIMSDRQLLYYCHITVVHILWMNWKKQSYHIPVIMFKFGILNDILIETLCRLPLP